MGRSVKFNFSLNQDRFKPAKCMSFEMQCKRCLCDENFGEDAKSAYHYSETAKDFEQLVNGTFY